MFENGYKKCTIFHDDEMTHYQHISTDISIILIEIHRNDIGNIW